jgi:nitrous oxidase accessory protein
MARLRKLAIPVGAAAAFVAVAALAAKPAPRDDTPAGTTGTIEMMIQDAAPGTVIVPPPGHYVGHVILDKPVILDGRGRVTLDAGGNGSVVDIQADNATLRGFHLVNTGEDPNAEDAGVKIHGNHDTVEDNVIENCWQGVNLAQSNGNVVRGNRISSKSDLTLGLKGDAIKLWYSNGNTISGNTVVNSRDIVVWYSNHNLIANNSAHHGRYGLHFMYAGQNTVEGNDFNDNSVGISMMYSEGVVIRHNRIASAIGSTGTCIAAKESSSLTIEDNDIVYCSQGIYLDVSPYQPGEVNTITGNRISFNDVAVGFLSDWHDNVFKDNVFTGNMTQVMVYGGGTANHNDWDGNTWDTYEGFDRNHDGIGDTPFDLMSYAGRVWMDRPETRFFKGTPLLEVVDFLDRLAPFSEPHLMLEDRHPRVPARTPEHDPGQQKAPKT